MHIAMTDSTIKKEICEISKLVQNFQKWPRTSKKAKKLTSSDRVQNFRKCYFNIDGHSIKS